MKVFQTFNCEDYLTSVEVVHLIYEKETYLRSDNREEKGQSEETTNFRISLDLNKLQVNKIRGIQLSRDQDFFKGWYMYPKMGFQPICRLLSRENI